MEQYLEKAIALLNNNHNLFIDSYRNEICINSLIEDWKLHFKEELSKELAEEIYRVYPSLSTERMYFSKDIQKIRDFFDDCLSKQNKFHSNSYSGINDLINSYNRFFKTKINYFTLAYYEVSRIIKIAEELNIKEDLFVQGQSPEKSEIDLAAKYFANKRITFSTKLDSSAFLLQPLHDFWLSHFNKYINEFNTGLIDWHIFSFLSEEIAQKCKNNSILIDEFQTNEISKISSDIFIKYPCGTNYKNLISIVRYNYPEVCFIHSSDQKYYLQYIQYLRKNSLLNLRDIGKSQQKIQHDWKLLFNQNIPLNTAKDILTTFWDQYPECFAEYNRLYQRFMNMYLTFQSHESLFKRSIFITSNLKELKEKFRFYSQEQIEELKDYISKNDIYVNNIQTLQSFWNDLFQETLTRRQAKEIFQHLKDHCFIIGKSGTKNFVFMKYLRDTSTIINLDFYGYRSSQKIWTKLFNTSISVPEIRDKLLNMKWKCPLCFTHTFSNNMSYQVLEYVIRHSIIIENSPSGFRNFQDLLQKWTIRKFTSKESKELFINIRNLYPECFIGEFNLTDHNILTIIDDEKRQELLLIFANYCQQNNIVFSLENPNNELFQENWRKCFDSYTKCTV